MNHSITWWEMLLYFLIGLSITLGLAFFTGFLPINPVDS